MRRLMLAAAVALAASWAVAQEDRNPAPPAGAKDSEAIIALVIDTDPVAKTITIKKDAALGMETEKVLTVDPKALTHLKSVMVGQKVKLEVRKDAAGRDVVTAIEKEPSAQEPEPPKPPDVP